MIGNFSVEAFNQLRFYRRNPLLAIGAGRQLQLIEVYVRDERKLIQTRSLDLIRVRGIGQLDISRSVLAMQWLDEQVCASECENHPIPYVKLQKKKIRVTVVYAVLWVYQLGTTHILSRYPPFFCCVWKEG